MKIAAFNGKNLGHKKVHDKSVIKHLTKIISRYSVIVLLEVVDKSGKAMETLLQELNKTDTNRKHPYVKTASKQLGRDTYKEQYVCFYRPDEVTLKDSHQYEDNQAGDEDAFAREPFILRFDCPTTVVQDLVLIPVHTKPEDSLKELDELHDVVEDIRKKWKNDNIMILGDFNADGRYLSKKKKEKIRICSPSYDWLIDDDVDTTASNNNDNTYDRIVVYGETMSNAIVPNSAKSFNFQQEFKLTDEEALSISDHYPVEVELKTRAGRQKRMAVPDGTEMTSGEEQSQKKGKQKKTEPAGSPKMAPKRAGAPKKKKDEPDRQQKKKNVRAKRKRGRASNTPTKRRRQDVQCS
ncbi:deoxyribonuclease-1-like isoform X2 [Simochromis diagramma]|uniref:deoxyribonuclease-1-like isoform X2 n=1 Tax=Simochromis diagramma TaxID=43689 RepID=UPI001A7E65F9|nr:deoxyribonuclease-1-like isoform X2 [Simochromis diagramma]XP_039865350.1 deoxyribonuclease-1-like isoform X2 [Simochromis diagramma]